MAITFQYFGSLGNAVFFICSAWFLIDNDKVSGRKILKMILDIWVVSVIICCYVLIKRDGNVSFKLLIKQLSLAINTVLILGANCIGLHVSYFSDKILLGGIIVVQEQYMYDDKAHGVYKKIVSISQPYIRPIVRGKAKAPVEFGAKLNLSIDDNGMQD